MDTCKCSCCSFYEKDSEHEWLGYCRNDEVRGKKGRILVTHYGDVYIAEDFGCIFGNQVSRDKWENE